LRAVIAKAWNAPNTMLGLALGAIGVAFGSSARLGNNAIQFLNHPLIVPRYALTLGNVVLYGCGASPSDRTRGGATLAEHERQHTLQGELLGPGYLVSNALGGAIALIRDGRWHGPSNWNERGPQSNPPRAW
jgi:hypothetical protein